MTVIDLDSHINEPKDWLEQRFPELAAQLPPPDEVGLAQSRAQDDMMDVLPSKVRNEQSAAEKPAESSGAAPTFFGHLVVMSKMTRAQAGEYVSTLSGDDADVGASILRSLHAKGAWDPNERVEILDEMGIDYQFALHGAHIPYVQAMKAGKPDLALEGMAAGNTFALENFSEVTNRVSPVTLVDLANLDWSIAEITRTRALGSRMVQIKSDPVDGMSIAHHDFDPFWSTVVDLGMVAMLHVGASSPRIDPGWNNHGGPAHHSTLIYFSQNPQVAQVALAGLIFGGVFERHPDLHLVVAELGFDWLPIWIKSMDRLAYNDGPVAKYLAAYEWSLLPSEFLQRQVHVAAIANNIDRLSDAFRDTPRGILSFSSDYPHTEGCGTGAMRLYRDVLSPYDARDVDDFYRAGSISSYLRATA